MPKVGPLPLMPGGDAAKTLSFAMFFSFGGVERPNQAPNLGLIHRQPARPGVR
jgi:hypothetical protein